MRHSLNDTIDNFLTFIDAHNQLAFKTILLDFFAQQCDDKEVIYDQGSLMLSHKGHILKSVQIDSEHGKVVRFNGLEINEINPFAYIQEDEYAYVMRGDDRQRKRRRKRGSGTNSNNNNNNNNNNNG